MSDKSTEGPKAKVPKLGGVTTFRVNFPPILTQSYQSMDPEVRYQWSDFVATPEPMEIQVQECRVYSPVRVTPKPFYVTRVIRTHGAHEEIKIKERVLIQPPSYLFWPPLRFQQVVSPHYRQYSGLGLKARIEAPPHRFLPQNWSHSWDFKTGAETHTVNWPLARKLPSMFEPIESILEEEDEGQEKGKGKCGVL
jgi:hypothetical protein